MSELDKGKGPVDPFPSERLAQGLASLDQPAWQESQAQMEGGSAKMQSQIGPKTG